MIIERAKYEILKPDIDDSKTISAIYRGIETAGRTCYKSEDKITDESAKKFVAKIIDNGHEAMLEHAYMTVRFTVDRGITHEMVRHRIASFAQESTRYCNYSKDKFGNEITVIEPVYFYDIPSERQAEIVDFMNMHATYPDFRNPKEDDFAHWYDACQYAERTYMHMISNGCTPEIARDVLPNSLKSEIVVTANMREWRHILNLRAAGITGKPHPQMLEVMVPLLNQLCLRMPELFDDIEPMAWVK